MSTIGRRSGFQAEGGTEARTVVEAPALLHLPRTGGLRDVLLARGAADAGRRGQRGCLVSNGLG